MAANSRKSKSQKMSHVVEEVATLSNFPDEILHHILSFVDTKSAVRTSLLSRRWRCLWKNVEVLNFLPKSFCKLASFRKHVYRLLSFRSYRTPVRNVTFELSGYAAEERRGHVIKTIEQVMKYAASHDGGGLDCLSIIGGGGDERMNFYHFDENVISGNHDSSLKTMKLEECVLWHDEFDDGVVRSRTTLGFKALTTLELRGCSLDSYPPGVPVDLIGDLPCLKYLKVLHCYVEPTMSWLLISGSQLLDLEMEFNYEYLIYELIAPKLKSLRLWGEHIDNHLCKFDLPSLDHANIRLKWVPYHWADDSVALKEWSSALVKHLRGLHNVESLKLCFDKEGDEDEDWEEHQFPLNRIMPVIEHEAPPFTRLKTLRIQCAHQQRSLNLPYQVLRYFLEGSPNTEDKFVKVEMLAD